MGGFLKGPFASSTKRVTHRSCHRVGVSTELHRWLVFANVLPLGNTLFAPKELECDIKPHQMSPPSEACQELFTLPPAQADFGDANALLSLTAAALGDMVMLSSLDAIDFSWLVVRARLKDGASLSEKTRRALQPFAVQDGGALFTIVGAIDLFMEQSFLRGMEGRLKSHKYVSAHDAHAVGGAPPIP